MRLLIVTQVVDTEDPVLGFFCRWVEEFAKHVERVEVICLKEGKHDFPQNVRVHSLGKEHGTASRAAYASRFLDLAWRLRNDYDTVFVHMNPEYVVLAGWLWRVLGKRVALWYTHKNVDMKLRMAVLWSNTIFTASKESFRLPTKKLIVTGHGIDTDFFTVDSSITRGSEWVSVGRLMPSKRHDLAIREAAVAGVGLHIAGVGQEQTHLEHLASSVGTRVTFLGALNQKQLRQEYRSAAKLIHRSETGSLDKVVLEASACGLLVDTTDPALARLPLTPDYVRTHHSLAALIPRILTEFHD